MLKTNKSIIKNFTSKVGLLYFGQINKDKDDHQVVNGFTVSNTHKDKHFSVGTSEGYDIHLVYRTDKIKHSPRQSHKQSWVIMSFNLHSKIDLPHFLIKMKNHNDYAFNVFFNKYTNISEIKLGTIEPYSANFTEKFCAYSRQSMSLATQRVITSETADLIAKHFGPIAIEQNEKILYLQIPTKNVSYNLLNAMYENGLWLSNKIDQQTDLI